MTAATAAASPAAAVAVTAMARRHAEPGGDAAAAPAARSPEAARWVLLDTVLRALGAAGIERGACAGTPIAVFAAAAGPGIADAGIADVIAWFLDLRGPCEAVAAGAASPLAALLRAAGSLRLGECEAVVAVVAAAGGALEVLVLEPVDRVRARGGPVRALLGAGRACHQGRGEGSEASPRPDWDALQALVEGGRSEPLTLSAGGPRGVLARLTVEPVPRAASHDPVVAVRGDGRGGHPPTFWIHGVSGDVGWVVGLARALPPALPVFGVEAQGFDGRGEVLATVEAMAEHYAEGILARGFAGPVWLGGYSGGGMLALETARRLRARGVATERLFLLDANAPGNTSLADAYVEGFILLLAGNWYGHLWGAKELLDYRALEGLTPERQLEATLDHLFRHARPPLSREALRRRLVAMDRICQATRHAMRAFAPRPLEGDTEVTLVRCRHGLGDHAGRFRIPALRIAGDYRAGWERLFARPMRVVEVEGDHWELLSPGRVEEVAAIIAAP